MLELTHDLVRELGSDAVMDIHNDVLYITNGHWMIVVTDPEGSIEESTLQLIGRAVEKCSSQPVLGILTAKELNWSNLSYIAPRCRKPSPMESDRSFSALEFESSTDGWMEIIFDEGPSVTQEFLAGRARPKYSEDKRNGRIARNDGAVSYTIKTSNNKVVVLNGSYLRALTELGFDLKVATRSTGDSLPPVCGCLEGEDTYAFLMPVNTSNIYESSDGRDIFYDAADVCWKSVDDALEYFRNPFYREPLSPRTYQDVLDGHGQERRGVGILRWLGCSEEDIEESWEQCRPDALRRRYENNLEHFERYLEDVKELSDDLPKWRVDNLKSKDKHCEKMCKEIEVISDYLGEDLGLGVLPQLAPLIKEKLDKCAS